MKAGWTTTTLAQVCEFRGGGTPSKAVERYWQGDIPWISPKDMKSEAIHDSVDHISENAIESSATSVIPQGSVLIVVRSGILQRTVPIAITGRDLAINQDLKALCPTDALDARFLYYFLQSRMKDLLGLVSRGATVHRLATDLIRRIEIPLPGLLEQQRIVRVLDGASAAIAIAEANTERNLQNARALFESSLETMFRKSDRLWVKRRLSDLCDIKHGFPFKSEFFADEGEYVMLTPGNFYESGGYRDRLAKQKYYRGEIPPGYILNKGDMLIAMTEQAAGLLGSPILIPQADKFLHNQRLGLVSKKPGVPWTNEFFFHVFNTKTVRKKIHESAAGVKVRHTSPRKIGEVVVSFPPSIAEQRSITSRLNEIKQEAVAFENIYRRKAEAVTELKQSLLHHAFSGAL